MNIGKLKLKPTSQPKQQFKSSKQKQQKKQIQKLIDQNLKTKDIITTFQPFPGQGLIVSSATTINGLQTKFKAQIQNGDFLLVQTNSLLKTTQEKQVMVVLGDRSILLKQPFIQQVTSYNKFMIRKKTLIQKGQDIGSEYKKKMEEIKKTKQITKDTIDLRIKKGMWKYQTQKVQVDKGASREQLLDIRAKKIKDKFCW